MNVEGMDDAEGDWISAARAVVGPDVPVAASYDLHGNVTQRIVDQLDIFAGYRTAPHIDVTATMVRAWFMLVRALTTGERPGVVWAPVPVLLPGERTSTEDEPAKSLYAVLPDHDRVPGIWDANLMVGYVWATSRAARPVRSSPPWTGPPALRLPRPSPDPTGMPARTSASARSRGRWMRCSLSPSAPTHGRSSWPTPATIRPAAGSAIAPTCWRR